MNTTHTLNQLRRYQPLLFALLFLSTNIRATHGQSIPKQDPAEESQPSKNGYAPNISIAEYRRRLDALEQPVQQLAERVRATEAKDGKDHADSAKLRADLKALVQQTFAARQEIQRAELAEFTRRLQHMKQSIETREKIAEKIVDRRVAELLNPDLNWDETKHSQKLSGELPHPSIRAESSDNKPSTAQIFLKSSREFQISGPDKITAGPGNARFNVIGETELTVQLSEFAGRHGLRLEMGILVRTSDSRVIESIAHNQVPVEITDDDFGRFASDESVTKVLYLPKGPSTSTSGFEQILSWQLVPELDPVKLAEERGTVVAVVRMTPSLRQVVPIQDVSELEGKWRWISMEYVAQQSTPTPSQVKQYIESSMNKELNKDPVLIGGEIWAWQGATPAEMSAEYHLKALPQSATLSRHDMPIQNRLLELHDDTLLTARHFSNSGRGNAIPPVSFDSNGVVIETYQRAGVITAVNAEKSQVHISLGLSDDIKIGQRLTVTSGDQIIGTVEVITVERDDCVARILDVVADRPIQKGDRIKIPEVQTPESGPNGTSSDSNANAPADAPQ